MKRITGPLDFAKEFNVSRETLDRLGVYAELLEKWNSRINLVSKSTIPDLWHRHMADSAQILALAPKHGRWLDIGSGAGFPGMVAAIMARQQSPELSFSLAESDERKAAFLATVARETATDVDILIGRIEGLDPAKADILSARALAPVSQLLEFAERHLNPGGTCLFPKGAQAESELTAARQTWHIEAEAFPSMTDSQASIYRIGAFSRV